MDAAIANPHRDRRWFVLAAIAVAQLLVVLDVTIVNIALPSAQQDLGFSDHDRQWVITAYALTFGSLLLLGGRIADLFGRKRTFIAGLFGFAAASALGGAAESFGLLVAARALQGAFAALLAPAALSLLTTTFTKPDERAKAFAVYAAIGGMGGAVGLLLGGVLTETLVWRWSLYVSVVFALPAAFASMRLLTHVPARNRPRLDLPGTLAASTGLFALVFGLARGEADGWGEPTTIVALAASAVLLTAFVAIQRGVANPLLPLRVVLDRNRGASFLAIGLASAGAFGVFLFLTFYLQGVRGMNPLETGLAFLPMSFLVAPTVAIVSTRILPRTGPRPLIPLGMGLAALGLALMTRIGIDTGYASHVLPPLALIAVGFAFTMAPAFATATLGVPPRDSGVASAMVNASQQVGGSIGIALLTTVAVAATNDFLATAAPGPQLAVQASVEGYVAALWWAAGVFALGAVICGALLRSDARPELKPGGPLPEAEAAPAAS